MRRPWPVLLIAVVFGLLAGPSPFAAEVGLADTWRDATTTQIELKKTLILAITTDTKIRHRFEDRFVTLLRGRELQATTSYSIVPDLRAVPDRDAVVTALLEQHVQGVIALRLVPLDAMTVEAWGAKWRDDLAKPILLRDYVNASLAQMNPDAAWYGVEATLWTMETRRCVWAARTKELQTGALRKGAGGLVEDIIDDLRFKNLLK